MSQSGTYEQFSRMLGHYWQAPPYHHRHNQPQQLFVAWWPPTSSCDERWSTIFPTLASNVRNGTIGLKPVVVVSIVSWKSRKVSVSRHLTKIITICSSRSSLHRSRGFPAIVRINGLHHPQRLQFVSLCCRHDPIPPLKGRVFRILLNPSLQNEGWH